MASYLFPFENTVIQPYSGPLELYGAALQYKNAKFTQGLANIRSHYDAVLNAPLTNEQDQQVLREGINTAMQKLSKASVGDLGLPENQAEINGVFDSILDDQDLVYDMAWTRRHASELRKAEDLQKKDPSLVPPQNLEPLFLAQEQFRSAPKGSRPKPTSFTPYYDFDKKMTEALDKVKPDVDQLFKQDNVKVQGPDGKMYSVSVNGQYTVEQLKDYTINKLAMERLSSDPQALNQMGLDYQYNTRNGLYPPSSAIRGIDDELSFYKTNADAIDVSLRTGLNLTDKTPLTDNQKLILAETKTSIDAESQKLKDLRNQITIDPTKSNQWFTFDKHVQDYVGSKVTQYAYTKKSLLSGIPGADNIMKYQLDTLLAQQKFGYDMQLEGVKAANTAKAKAAEKAAEFADVPAPLNDLKTRLDASGGIIHAEKPEIAALGEMFVDKDGRMFKDWSGVGESPETTLIATPGSGNLTDDQLSAINIGTVYGKMSRALEGLGLKTTESYTDPVQTSPTTGITSGGNTRTIEVDIKADDLIAQYRKNPEAVDSRVKSIIEKYQPILGVDIKDENALKAAKEKLNDPTIKNSVEWGLNLKLNGRFEFVPDNGNNLVASKDKRMLMKGHLVVPSGKADSSIGSRAVADGMHKSYILDWGNQKYTDEDGKTKAEQTVAISVYMPVSGNDIENNDRLLKNKGYQDQWGAKAPQFRAASAEKVRNLNEKVAFAESLPANDNLVEKGPDGQYRLTNILRYPDKVDMTVPRSQVIQLANEVSTRTGIPYNETLQGLVNVLGESKTSLQRAVGLDRFINTVGSSAPDMNSRAARNNNPLNIKDNEVSGVATTGKDDQNHAVFGTVWDGLNAGYLKINRIQQGLSPNKDYKADATIEEFSKVYAESPTDAQNLISALRSVGFNVTAETKINQIPTKILVEAIIMKEDRKYYNYIKSAGILDQFLNQIQ